MKTEFKKCVSQELQGLFEFFWYKNKSKILEF